MKFVGYKRAIKIQMLNKEIIYVHTFNSNCSGSLWRLRIGSMKQVTLSSFMRMYATIAHIKTFKDLRYFIMVIFK